MNLDELAEAATVSTDLSDVRALAMRQLDLEAEVSRCEQALKEAKNNLRAVEESELPAALRAAGIPKFHLSNGMTVSYKEDLKISVPKKNMDGVIAYMREWGFGGHVSNRLVVDVGKGQDNAVQTLIGTAESMGLKAELTENVASATVKKVLNLRMKEGKSDDLPFFGAYSYTKSTVK